MDGKQIARSLATLVIKVAIAVLIVVLVYKLAVSAYTFGFRVFAESPMTEDGGIAVTVTITEKDGVSDIGTILYNNGLIRDKKLFWFQERFSNYHGMELPGTYSLNTGMTVEEMLGVMATTPEEQETGTSGTAAEDTQEYGEEGTGGTSDAGAEEGTGDTEAETGE